MTRPDGLTEEEGEAMDALVDAIAAFHDLPRTHPNEWPEFVDAIHRLQGLLAIRIAQREHPEGWPTYPEET